MSQNKYAEEMVLVPKDRVKGEPGSGRDQMEEFWQRRALVDRLTNAPHVDRMRALLKDMKSSEGKAKAPSLPGYGVHGSDYFRLQRVLKDAQAIPKKRLSKFEDRGVPVTPLPTPSSVPRSEELDGFIRRAEDELAAAERWHWNDQNVVNRARQKLTLVKDLADTIRKDEQVIESEFSDRLPLGEQIRHGKEEAKRRRDQNVRLAKERRDKFYDKLTNLDSDPTGGTTALVPLAPPETWEETKERHRLIEQELRGYIRRAQDDLARALNSKDNNKIARARQQLTSVESLAEGIREDEKIIDSGGVPNYNILDYFRYSRDELKRRNMNSMEFAKERRERYRHKLEKMYPDQKGKGRRVVVWYRPRGWIQE